MTNIYCTIKNAERKALIADKAKKETNIEKEAKTEIVSCKKVETLQNLLKGTSKN